MHSFDVYCSVVFIYSQIDAILTIAILVHSHHPKKKKKTIAFNRHSSKPLQPLENTSLSSVSVDLSLLDISCRGTLMAFDVWLF